MVLWINLKFFKIICCHHVWRNDRKEIQLFLLSEISIYLSWIFILYINDFVMVWNQDAFRILSSIPFETFEKELDGSETQSMISGKLFSFSNFSKVWNFRQKFRYQLKKFFLINYQYFWSYDTVFVKILTHCKIDLKHAVTIPSDQAYCLIYIYTCIKFHCVKVRGSWVIGI